MRLRMVSELPPVMTASDEDGLLLVGRDETVTFAHLKILLATKSGDEVTTDAMLHVTGHLVVHIRKTTLHHHALRRAEHLTLLTAVVWVEGVHGVKGWQSPVGIATHQPAQTLVVKGTVFSETHEIALGFLLERFFLQLGG